MTVCVQLKYSELVEETVWDVSDLTYSPGGTAHAATPRSPSGGGRARFGEPAHLLGYPRNKPKDSLKR